MNKFLKKIIVISVVTMLVLSVTSCQSQPLKTQTPEYPQTGNPTPALTVSDLWSNAKYTENTEIGKGSKTITVEVIAEAKSVIFTLKTDATTLGEALIEEKIVEGENAQYGLYIKYANGIRADYDLDKAYWGLTKNGGYLMTGADKTNISDGERYELTYTKG